MQMSKNVNNDVSMNPPIGREAELSDLKTAFTLTPALS